MFETPSGELWLLYTAQLSRGTMRVEEWYEKVRRGEEKGHFSMQETAQIRRRISRDGGRTWGEAEVLFDKPGSFCRHPILPLSNGEWISPVWYSLGEEDANKPQYGRDYSAVQISSDQGATWHEYPVPGSVRRVHMSIVETAPGRFSRVFPQPLGRPHLQIHFAGLWPHVDGAARHLPAQQQRLHPGEKAIERARRAGVQPL